MTELTNHHVTRRGGDPSVVISLRLITIEINEVELLIDWKKKEELQAYLYTLSAKLWQAKNRTIEERRIK